MIRVLPRYRLNTLPLCTQSKFLLRSRSAFSWASSGSWHFIALSLFAHFWPRWYENRVVYMSPAVRYIEFFCRISGSAEYPVSGRISGWIVNIEFWLIFIFWSLYRMGPKQFLLGGYPANETDIRPDTGYKERLDIRPAGYPLQP